MAGISITKFTKEHHDLQQSEYAQITIGQAIDHILATKAEAFEGVRDLTLEFSDGDWEQFLKAHHAGKSDKAVPVASPVNDLYKTSTKRKGY